jgi:hypothetical protein
MAYITVVSGGAQPVFATDVLNGNPAQSGNLANAAVTNFQGPKLDFFSLTANTVLSTAGAGNASGYVSNVLQAIQQTSTVAMYQVIPSAQQVLNIALYPTGAYTTATLVAAAQQANATGGLNIGIPTANVSATASFTTQGTYYIS